MTDHIRIEPQPKTPEGGWGLHETDATGRWFRPANTQGNHDWPIYPLIPPVGINTTHAYCFEHEQWEWISQSDQAGFLEAWHTVLRFRQFTAENLGAT